MDSPPMARFKISDCDGKGLTNVLSFAGPPMARFKISDCDVEWSFGFLFVLSTANGSL